MCVLSEFLLPSFFFYTLLNESSERRSRRPLSLGFKGLGSRHAYLQILNVLTVLGVSSHRLGECQSDMRKRPINIHSRLEVENVAPIKSRSSGATEY